MTEQRESPSVTARRREHEKELERVGIGSDEGQALLDRWHREDVARYRGSHREERTNDDE